MDKSEINILTGQLVIIAAWCAVLVIGMRLL